jgi:hypothetical protein
MKKQTKAEKTSLLRVPKASKFDLKVKPIAMPHDDLIKPEAPKLEIVQLIEKKTDSTDTTGTINTIGTTGTTRQKVSPERDFTKTPNSLVRIVLAQGLFRGKSKQIYDYLWSVSRGAINPTRKIRKTLNEIQKGSGLGSRNTVLAGIKHLENIKLIIREIAVGELAGNSYEIFTAEELGYGFGTTGSTNITGTTETNQKAVLPILPDSGTTGTIQTIEKKGDSVTPKTSFKDIENSDDEPFGKMNETLAKVFEKVSGKRPQKKDSEKLNDFAELIAMELEIAAARTKSVSNVPAFLTEHLRRRLIGKSAQAEGKVKASKSTKIAGKPENVVEEYKAEPLTEQGREAVLKTMTEYIGKGQQEFIMSQQDSYTKDDWD